MRTAGMARRLVMALMAINVLAEHRAKASGARRGAEGSIEHRGCENHRYKLRMRCLSAHHLNKRMIRPVS